MFCTECGKHMSEATYRQKSVDETPLPVFCSKKCAIDYVLRMFGIEKVEK